MIDQWEDDSDEVLDQAEIDSLDDDDFDNSYTDSDRYDSPEDDAAELRGTSQCDGLCDPQCDWCLVSHSCPDDCGGNNCPYNSIVETKEKCGACDGAGHNGWEACADCHGTGSFPP